MKGAKLEKEKKTERVGRYSASFSKMDATGVGDHLPLKNKSRRRCIRCTSKKIEKRTNFVCKNMKHPVMHGLLCGIA